MERVRTTLKWKQRSDMTKTAIMLGIVVVATFGGYGIFMLGMQTGTPLVVVTSESMLPTLEVGDLLVLQGRAESQIHVGDIIVFNDTDWTTTNPVVHRVISIEEIDGVTHFITKGDNNHGTDPGFRTMDEIVGVMILRIPYIGSISMFLKTPAGLATIAIIFLLIIILPEIICKDKSEKEDNSPETEERLINEHPHE
ncbi:MAG: signal peptidase I [Candidatus Thorarchaeota archaeon]